MGNQNGYWTAAAEWIWKGVIRSPDLRRREGEEDVATGVVTSLADTIHRHRLRIFFDLSYFPVSSERMYGGDYGSGSVLSCPSS